VEFSFDFNFSDTLFIKGRKEEEDIVYDTIIIGGGPAAMTSALYLARKGCSVLVLTEKAGGQLVETSSVENYPAVDLISGNGLAEKFNEIIKKFEIRFIEGKRVESIVDADGIKVITVNSEEKYTAKTVIIATGSRWKELNIPGEKEFKTKGVAYCTTCDAPFFKGKRVVVAGGGNSGVEAAIDLVKIAEKITLIEYAKELKADSILINSLLKNDNVEIIKYHEILEIKGNIKVEKITVKERESEEIYEIECDGIFVEIGVQPNTGFVEEIIKLNDRKEIVIDSKCRTSQVGIFAAGDVTDVPYKQIVIAAGEGAKAALSAYEYISLKGE
jgi:NADH-dependent peroxiredoxin subunit F